MQRYSREQTMAECMALTHKLEERGTLTLQEAAKALVHDVVAMTRIGLLLEMSDMCEPDSVAYKALIHQAGQEFELSRAEVEAQTQGLQMLDLSRATVQNDAS